MNNYIFEEQFKQVLIEEAKRIGIRLSSKDSFSKTLNSFYNVRHKFIDAIPRIALMSKPLLSKFFTHPKRKEIEVIYSCLKKGNNINHFQSKKIIQSNFHDHLRNEWNIFHFHLSLKLDKKSSFVKQVNELLFVYIEKDKAILLDVSKHTPGVFADKKWIQILHDYHPEVISNYKLGWKDINPKLGALERQEIWNKGYTVGAMKVRDTVYMSPGVGRVTTGLALNVGRQTDDILRWMHKLDNQIKESIKHLKIYLSLATNPKFEIEFWEDSLVLFERFSQTILLKYPEILADVDEIIEINKKRSQI